MFKFQLLDRLICGAGTSGKIYVGNVIFRMMGMTSLKNLCDYHVSNDHVNDKNSDRWVVINVIMCRPLLETWSGVCPPSRAPRTLQLKNFNMRHPRTAMSVSLLLFHVYTHSQ